MNGAVTRFIAILACLTVIDCLTGFTSFMNAFIPPPTGEISTGWKLAIGIVAVGVLIWQVIRFAVWVASLAIRRVPGGRWAGRALILAMTRTRRHGMLHEAAVRWLWLQVEGRRLKSVATIARRVRGEVVVRRPARIPEHVIEETARDAYRGDNIVPIGLKPKRKAA